MESGAGGPEDLDAAFQEALERARAFSKRLEELLEQARESRARLEELRHRRRLGHGSDRDGHGD
jgi:hypothetical protein